MARELAELNGPAAHAPRTSATLADAPLASAGKGSASRPTSPAAPSAATAPVRLPPPLTAPAAPPPTRVASNDPAAGLSALADAPVTGETLKSWPSGFAQAPAFDEEHPEELSYRPFAIGPILTQHTGDDHPVLARMQHPDTGRVFEMLDEPDRLFPLTFRPGKQVAELMWAGQFNGAKVGSDTLMGRLKSGASALVIQRQVSTTYQR